jgi:hypothetical protein
MSDKYLLHSEEDKSLDILGILNVRDFPSPHKIVTRAPITTAEFFRELTENPDEPQSDFTPMIPVPRRGPPAGAAVLTPAVA